MPLHPNNKHKNGYDFKLLCKENPNLISYVFVNKFGNQTIDFSNPKAVKVLNSALLQTHYGITYWKFSEANLCPPIPGRVDYIHHLSDLLTPINGSEKNILDIGTGATCIYPLLGTQEYHWNFVATDIDMHSIENAQQIINKNNLENKIQLRHQSDAGDILNHIIKSTDTFDACMCNPPFFNSQEDAKKATQQKLKGLGKENNAKRNFSGTKNELCYKGGEKAFLHNYLYQSSLFKKQVYWFTSLLSKKENIRPMKVSLKKLGATETRIIKMEQGNKITRFMAWTFLSIQEQKKW